MPFKPGQSGNPQGRPIGSKDKPKDTAIRNLYEDIIGTFKTGKHYVYKHVHGGNTVYIGKGKENRAWDLIDRKKSYLRYLSEINNDIEVRIIASDLSEDEALAVEKALININKPVGNIHT